MNQMAIPRKLEILIEANLEHERTCDCEAHRVDRMTKKEMDAIRVICARPVSWQCIVNIITGYAAEEPDFFYSIMTHIRQSLMANKETIN